MKNMYIKPCFKPITLSAGGGSGACDVKTAQNGFEQCSVDIEGLGSIFGGAYNVDCEFDADDGFGICYFTSGPNATVFGSN